MVRETLWQGRSESSAKMARPAGIEPAVLVLETKGLPLTDGRIWRIGDRSPTTERRP